ncbi:MAG: magnesium transporter [Bdellovibrio sp.]|nr:magnesium transporter [Bdellovibrio sp.]
MKIFDGLTDINIHFSSLIGVKIFSNEEMLVGKVTDLFVDFEEMYPPILAVQFKKNDQYFYVHWSDIVQFSLRKIVVKADFTLGRSRTLPRITARRFLHSQVADQFNRSASENSSSSDKREDTMVEYPPLGKVILDRQIVDTSGKKVVRVNDIEFVKAGNQLRITHAAIGMRSMIRRLGYEKLVDRALRLCNPNAQYLKKEALINWKFVHAIPSKSIYGHVRLGLKNEEIQNLHPADLADILEDLDNYSRETLFSNLSPELAAATLSEVESDLQVELLKNEDPEGVAKIIENMGVDEAVDVLSEMEHEQANEIIANIEDNETQEEIQELLEYDQDVAGGLMSTEIFQFGPHHRRSHILKTIQEQYKDLETVYDIFVIDSQGRLIGATSLSKLLIQTEDIEIGELMNKTDLKYLHPSTPWRDVAKHMSKYNLITVPIVDQKQTLMGIISVDDILPWLLDEK